MCHWCETRKRALSPYPFRPAPFEMSCVCHCDGLCKLNKEELLAILEVRLKPLNTKELQALLIFVDSWKASRKSVVEGDA